MEDPPGHVGLNASPGAVPGGEEPPIHAPRLEEIRAARERIRGTALRTPLVRLPVELDGEVWLKLENLQPIGSFKLRGAANALARRDPCDLENGVWTASAGNMAQGVAWAARERGIPCSVVVPDTAPRTKIDAIARLGARIVPTTVASWFEVFRTRRFPGMHGLFIHAFADTDVMAGNGTIALEIVEDLEGVDAVIVPFGGGGLACGIAAGLRDVRPGCEVFAAEVEDQAPLAASFAAGAPAEIAYTPSFVDGIGGPRVEPGMWVLAEALLAGSLVVSLPEVASAVRLLVERTRVVAEGAGAASVAAALSCALEGRKLVAVVSGGNLDTERLVTILEGGVP